MMDFYSSIKLSKEIIELSIKQIKVEHDFNHLKNVTEEELNNALEKYLIFSFKIQSLFATLIKQFTENKSIFNKFKKINNPKINNLLKLNRESRSILNIIFIYLEKNLILINKINLNILTKNNKISLSDEIKILNLKIKELISKKDKKDNDFKLLISMFFSHYHLKNISLISAKITH